MRGSPRGFLVVPVYFFLVLLVLSLPAAASHDAKRFELDANAMNSGASGEDWNVVVPSDLSTANIVSSFVMDQSNPPLDRSYFTGGGSKDLEDVTAWRHTTGDVAPDKNEITHAFASAYRATVDTGRTNVGDLLVYFGLDRFANNGDAQVGFWFFRRPVAMASGGTFLGRHTAGDILVLSHFTQGGRVSDVMVYAWVGSGGSDGTLDLLMTARECSAAAHDDAACAIVNRSVTSSPWAYSPKAGAPNVFPSGSFYEGGVNVSRLVPGVQCFKSFMAETRSSQSVTAQLKDLALGPFDTCPVTTVSGPIVPVGGPLGPPLAQSGSETGPLAVIGATFLVVGFATRLAGVRRVQLTASIAAARWRDATHQKCSVGGAVRERWTASSPEHRPARRG